MVELGQLLACPLRNGISPASTGRVEQEVLTLSAITGGMFRPDARKLAPFRSAHAADKTVKRSELLICRGNGNIELVGRACRPSRDMPTVAFPDTMIAARLDPSRVDLDYMEHVWRSRPVRDQIHTLARSTNGTHKINQTMIQGIQVPLPPVDEQRRIAAILDAADTLRAKRRRALERLDVLVQAVFVDMFGNEVGRLVKLEDVAEVQGGLQVISGRKTNPIEVPYLRVANVFRGRLDLNEIKSMRVTENELARTALSQGDLLVVEGHGNKNEIGRVAVWDGSVEPCAHQNHLIRVRCRRTELEPRFAEVYLNSIVGRRALLKAANTTSGLNTISTRDVRAVTLPLPSRQRQTHFVKAAQAIDALRRQMSEAEARVAHLFASLQQRAFAGEL